MSYSRSNSLYFIAIISLFFFACSNSESINYTEDSEYKELFNNIDEGNNSSNSNKIQISSSNIREYLPLDDTEYPYAGIPRIVIETENRHAIKDRETEIPAKLQIWGAKTPESVIMDLTIRGRGNSSWMSPKKSYKIEFINKQSLLGMPKDRDWALIGNYADKTLMKNYLMYHLSANLEALYAPRCEFVELFLNNEYLGVYLLSETVKIGENRVNIPQSNYSYLIEITENHQKNDQLVYSHIIKSDSIGKTFHVHSPKKASTEILLSIKENIENFETYLKTIKDNKDNNINQKFDLDACIKYYWVQEFSKNSDAFDYSSIFFSWEKDGRIKMGPVWDFDLALGGRRSETLNQPQNWLIKKGYWLNYIFKDAIAEQARTKFWIENKDKLYKTISDVDSLYIVLKKAARNNFQRWNILQSTAYTYHNRPYSTYEDAIEDLKTWIKERFKWIDKELAP